MLRHLWVNIATSRKKEAGRLIEANKLAVMSEQARKMADDIKNEIAEPCITVRKTNDPYTVKPL